MLWEQRCSEATMRREFNRWFKGTGGQGLRELRMLPQGDQNEGTNEGKRNRKVNEKMDCVGDKETREGEEELVRFQQKAENAGKQSFPDRVNNVLEAAWSPWRASCLLLPLNICKASVRLSGSSTNPSQGKFPCWLHKAALSWV